MSGDGHNQTHDTRAGWDDCDNTTHVCSCGQPFDLVHDADCNIWLNEVSR